MDRAAHLANVERPDRVNALILDHLLGQPIRDDASETVTIKEVP